MWGRRYNSIARRGSLDSHFPGELEPRSHALLRRAGFSFALSLLLTKRSWRSIVVSTRHRCRATQEQAMTQTAEARLIPGAHWSRASMTSIELVVRGTNKGHIKLNDDRAWSWAYKDHGGTVPTLAGAMMIVEAMYLGYTAVPPSQGVDPEPCQEPERVDPTEARFSGLEIVDAPRPTSEDTSSHLRFENLDF